MKLITKLPTAVQPGLFDEFNAGAADAGQFPSASLALPAVVPPDATRRVMMLSLWQPWASFCVWRNPVDGLAEKQVETRHWATNYRGLLAIHATRSLTPAAKSSIRDVQIFAETLRLHAGDFQNDLRELNARLVFGAVVGVVEFYDVQAFPAADTGASWVAGNYPPREKYFGNYAGGRFGWRLRNPVRFREPIPARGLQRFGRPTPDVVREILDRLHNLPEGASVI